MELRHFLFRFRIRVVSGWLGRNRAAKIITIGLFLLVILGLMTGIYRFALAVFSYLQSDPAVAHIASAYTYELFLLVLGLFVIGSTLISSVITLFRQPSQGLIMATPAAKQLFSLNVRTISLSGCWPFLLFFLPTLLALQTSFSIGFIGFLLACLGIALLSLLLSMLSVVVVLALASILYLVGRLGLRSLRSSIALLSLIGLVGIGNWSEKGNLFDISSLIFSSGSTRTVSAITQRFHLLPTHPAAELLYALQERQTPWPWLIVLAIGVLMSYLLLRILAVHYIVLWQTLQEGEFVAKTESVKNLHSLDPLLLAAHSPLGAVTAKEALLFRRDHQQLLWFGFLVGMWVVQTILVSGTVHHELVSGSSSLLLIIEPLQFLVTLYFVATACLRFVFPAFSSERRSAWLIASSPLDLRQLLFAKTSLFSILFTLSGLVISAVNFSLLELRITTSSYTDLLLALAIITLVQLSLCLGVWFPNFDTDDPEVLSTSLPGLFLIALSLIYAGLGSLSLRSYLQGDIEPSLVWLAISLLLIPGLYLVARQKVNHFEFVKLTS